MSFSSYFSAKPKGVTLKKDYNSMEELDCGQNLDIDWCLPQEHNMVHCIHVEAL